MKKSCISGKLPLVMFATAWLACAGCGASQSAYTAPPGDSGAAARSDSKSNIVGVYQGTTRAYCMHTLPSRCNAVQDVTITLVENDDSKIGGSYRCSYGNMNCYHMNESGKVILTSVEGSRLNVRVLMPDGTSCIYTGRNVSGDINGGYSCFAGGSLIEQGMWLAKKEY